MLMVICIALIQVRTVGTALSKTKGAILCVSICFEPGSLELAEPLFCSPGMSVGDRYFDVDICFVVLGRISTCITLVMN